MQLPVAARILSYYYRNVTDDESKLFECHHTFGGCGWECEVMRLTAWGNGSQRRRSFDTHRPYQTWNWVIGSPGQWVIWVIFYVRVTGSSFWPGVRPEFFPVFEKIPKMQNVHLKCWNDKSHCQVSVVRLKSLDVSPCNELLLSPMIITNS